MIDSHYFPGACILFDGKSTPLYTAAWKKIQELLPGFHPQTGHADFEGPQQKAAEEQTGMLVKFCRFHFSTATFRNMQVSNQRIEIPIFSLFTIQSMPSMFKSCKVFSCFLFAEAWLNASLSTK